ncbi:MAG: LysM peptidoglycan-binding domain-containing protein [Chloroflexi bacterium]|nr:LysM peptidoglycan-binding domain-containing protein [Chloroflexota bacterium]
MRNKRVRHSMAVGLLIMVSVLLVFAGQPSLAHAGTVGPQEITQSLRSNTIPDPACSDCISPLQGHPPPGFLFYCTGSGVLVANGGVAVLEATFSQIAGPLQTATRTAKNQLITSAGGISLYAPKSNELQVHYDRNPDGTKLIVKSDICGPIATQAATQPNIIPPATVPTITQTTTNMAGRTTYLVQAGDNLYRISLRFNRSMTAIATANGITNLNLIYVGQVLIIP